jgi:hypothetical protein
VRKVRKVREKRYGEAWEAMLRLDLGPYKKRLFEILSYLGASGLSTKINK